MTVSANGSKLQEWAKSKFNYSNGTKALIPIAGLGACIAYPCGGEINFKVADIVKA
jgi:hypothetical protein